jgi:hypothetical protein
MNVTIVPDIDISETEISSADSEKMKQLNNDMLEK